MALTFLFSFLFAMSLCADCFAVSICSGITLRQRKRGAEWLVALTLAFVQAGLLFLGAAFGSIFAKSISRMAGIVGFLLLLYVGGGMVYEGWKKEGVCRNLSGMKNVILGALATSIDAFVAGVSLALSHQDNVDVAWKVFFVWLCTFISVAGGLFFGEKIGLRFGFKAEIVGGIVLIIIGLSLLL